jgi:hypothetical protein
MSTVEDVNAELGATLERGLDVGLEAGLGGAQPAPTSFDARWTATVVDQEMATALQAWRSEPALRLEPPRSGWRGVIGQRRPGALVRKAPVRAVAIYAGAAGLVGVAIGVLLAQPSHRPSAASRPSSSGQVASAPPPAAPRSAARSTAPLIAQGPVPDRPDPIGRLYAEIEAHRRAVHPGRRAHGDGGPACPASPGAQRTLCLTEAIDRADRELRRSYQQAIERHVGSETLNRYREAWTRLRRRDAEHPDALIQGYRRLALEIRHDASAHAPRRGAASYRFVRDHPWY